MPTLADKLEEATSRRAAARGLSTSVFNEASAEIVRLLDEVERIVLSLGLKEEFEKTYHAGGHPIDNIVAFLRSHL